MKEEEDSRKQSTEDMKVINIEKKEIEITVMKEKLFLKLVHAIHGLSMLLK